MILPIWDCIEGDILVMLLGLVKAVQHYLSMMEKYCCDSSNFIILSCQAKKKASWKPFPSCSELSLIKHMEQLLKKAA